MPDHVGTSASRFWLADPWRMNTHMPLRRFSAASAAQCSHDRIRRPPPDRHRARDRARRGYARRRARPGRGHPREHLRVARDDPGKFITSATPIAPWRSISAAMSPASSVAPERSNGEAGTQLEAQSANVNGSGARPARGRGPRAHRGRWRSRAGRRPPQSSPGGRTAATNSSIHSLVDSRCMWASTKPGVSAAPSTSTVSQGLALAPSGHHPVRDRQRCRTHSRVAGEHPPASDQEVGRRVSPGDRRVRGGWRADVTSLQAWHSPRNGAA